MSDSVDKQKRLCAAVDSELCRKFKIYLATNDLTFHAWLVDAIDFALASKSADAQSCQFEPQLQTALDILASQGIVPEEAK